MVIPLHKLRILAVGCHDDTLKRISDFCSSGPYFKLVGFVLEGRFAAALCRELSPDVILIDASVDMNSVDVLRSVREVLPPALLIMMSMANDEVWLRACMAAGTDNFLTKPLDLSEFDNTIRVTYERKKL